MAAEPSPSHAPSAADLLLARLELHEQEEAAVLGKYRSAARHADDPAVRFLMHAVLEDEQRHHRWIASVAQGIRELLEQSQTRAFPRFESTPETRAELIVQTQEFIEAERTALGDLRKLKRTVDWAEAGDRALYEGKELARPAEMLDWLRQSPLEPIVDTMVDDTKRHIRLLRFIERQLRQPARARTASPDAQRQPNAPRAEAEPENRITQGVHAHEVDDARFLAVEDHHAETCTGLYEVDPYDVLATPEKPDCKTPYEWGEASAINAMNR